MPEPRRVRVAVVFGGRSTEHAISCVSAGSILRALDPQRYDVVPVGISADGRWVLSAGDPERLAIADGRLPAVDPGDAALILAADPTRRELVVHEEGSTPRELAEVDVVFPVLHGPYGEDGTIQGLLELSGTPYVGSGVLASAAAMDKDAMKRLLASAGLPVARWVLVREGRPVPVGVRDLALPLFVKPARGGSSIGISRVTDLAGLDDALAEAFRHDPKVVVEEGVPGREIECGVLEGVDGGPPEASVPAEIRVGGEHDFYDFEAKYLDDGSTRLDVPADLPDDVAARVRALSVRAFEALDCEGLARVDFFLRPDGELVLNEVNTMPGFTPSSMFPRMWAATGLDYPSLVDRLVRSALARRAGLR